MVGHNQSSGALRRRIHYLFPSGRPQARQHYARRQTLTRVSTVVRSGSTPRRSPTPIPAPPSWRHRICHRDRDRSRPQRLSRRQALDRKRWASSSLTPRSRSTSLTGAVVAFHTFAPPGGRRMEGAHMATGLNHPVVHISYKDAEAYAHSVGTCYRPKLNGESRRAAGWNTISFAWGDSSCRLPRNMATHMAGCHLSISENRRRADGCAKDLTGAARFPSRQRLRRTHIRQCLGMDVGLVFRPGTCRQGSEGVLAFPRTPRRTGRMQLRSRQPCLRIPRKC